jgi:hypothetical protein
MIPAEDTMPQTLELPDELADALTEEALRAGLSMPDYAVQLLTTGRQSDPPVRNGAELVAYWRAAGLIGSRPDINDASAHARQLREQAERRTP